MCGFHAPGRWDEIVALHDCLLASERGNEARERIVEWCREQSLTAYDRRTGEGLLRNLVVREGRRTGAIQVRLVTSAGRGSTASRWRAPAPGSTGCCGRADRAPRRDDARAARPSCWRAPSASRRCWASMRFAISAEAFFQTNTEMAERLYELAIEYAQPTRLRARLRPLLRDRHDRALDRSAGGRGVGPRGRRRGDRRRDRQRARQRDRQRPLLRRRRAAGAARAGRARPGAPTSLVVDPPRAGLSQKVVRRIIEAAPQRIVYVSCNPTTLAPNAAQLVRGRLRARARAPGRHVPADAAHRVRRRADARHLRNGHPVRRPVGPCSHRAGRRRWTVKPAFASSLKISWA